MAKKKDIAGNWLKDPATYPLIVCVSSMSVGKDTTPRRLAKKKTLSQFTFSFLWPARWALLGLWWLVSLDRASCTVLMFRSILKSVEPCCVPGAFKGLVSNPDVSNHLR